MIDSKAVIANLETLSQAAFSVDTTHQDSINTFIYVGEYGLAMEGIADAYLKGNVRMPTDLFQMFEKLATLMDLNSDPEYEAVAEFTKIHGSAPSRASDAKIS